MKQGPYGAKPVVKRALVITPGSLVKVSNIHLETFDMAVFMNILINLTILIILLNIILSKIHPNLIV